MVWMTHSLHFQYHGTIGKFSSILTFYKNKKITLHCSYLCYKDYGQLQKISQVGQKTFWVLIIL